MRESWQVCMWPAIIYESGVWLQAAVCQPIIMLDRSNQSSVFIACDCLHYCEVKVYLSTWNATLHLIPTIWLAKEEAAQLYEHTKCFLPGNPCMTTVEVVAHRNSCSCRWNRGVMLDGQSYSIKLALTHCWGCSCLQFLHCHSGWQCWRIFSDLKICWQYRMMLIRISGEWHARN